MAQQQRERGVRNAVAAQQGEVDEWKEQVKAVEARVVAARGWFDRVAPAHVDADQMVAMGQGVIRRDVKLAQAAVQSPETFMSALSECARLGLVPGETYHLLPFWSNERKVMEVSGIVDYKGEIELIYRAGGVTAVHGQVVRENDEFLWRPTEMELPLHRFGDGLVDEAERGGLRGVYAYARMAAGGWSQPIVMGRAEVMRHKDVAKSDKFWNGPWEPDMWLKTAFHKLYDRVPKSAEFLQDRLRAAAGDDRPAPVAAPASHPAVAPAPPATPVAAITSPPPTEPPAAPGGARTRTPGSNPPEPPAEDAPDGEGEDKLRVNRARRLAAMFTRSGVGTADRAMRLRLTGLFANPDGAPLWIESTNELSAEQVKTAISTFAAVLDAAEKSGDITDQAGLYAHLRHLADQVQDREENGVVHGDTGALSGDEDE